MAQPARAEESLRHDFQRDRIDTKGGQLVIGAARHLFRWVDFQTATPLQRVDTPRWREVRRRELERCLARFESPDR
jgi:hypothetical protein